MTKKQQYPNKNYLIEKAIKLFPNYTRFGIIAFREFNLQNPLDKKLFAIEQRLKQINPNNKERVFIIAYLLKNKKQLRLEKELVEILNQKYPYYNFVDEESLSN